MSAGWWRRSDEGGAQVSLPRDVPPPGLVALIAVDPLLQAVLDRFPGAVIISVRPAGGSSPAR